MVLGHGGGWWPWMVVVAMMLVGEEWQGVVGDRQYMVVVTRKVLTVNKKVMIVTKILKDKNAHATNK